MNKIIVALLLTLSLNLHASEKKSAESAEKKSIVFSDQKAPATTDQKTSATTANSVSDSEYSKEIAVNGMVCAFCASSLKKKFEKNKAVEKINVDLENKKVSVKFKDGKSMKDKELKKIITASGFKVVSIRDIKKIQ